MSFHIHRCHSTSIGVSDGMAEARLYCSGLVGSFISDDNARGIFDSTASHGCSVVFCGKYTVAGGGAGMYTGVECIVQAPRLHEN